MPEQAITLTMAGHIAKREVKEEWKRQRIKLSTSKCGSFPRSCRYLISMLTGQS